MATSSGRIWGAAGMFSHVVKVGLADAAQLVERVGDEVDHHTA